MIKYFNIYPVILAALLIICSFSASAGDYVVIVNKQNPAEAVSKSDLKKYFFKNLVFWKNGTKVIPVDYLDTHPLASSFSMDVLDMNLEEKKHKMVANVFSGKSTPPRQLATEEEVIETVSTNVGAIGYVSVRTNTDKVKVVQLH